MQDVVSIVTQTVKKNFDQKDPVAVSISIDASKIAPLMQIDVRNRLIVRDATPNHSIKLLVTQNEINDILDYFYGGEAKLKVAHEIKVDTMVCQSEKKGMTPCKQLMACPQTKNENSNFNEKVGEALVKAEADLRSDGHHFSFLNTASDGISCDSKFFLDGLVLFLEENRIFVHNRFKSQCKKCKVPVRDWW